MKQKHKERNRANLEKLKSDPDKYQKKLEYNRNYRKSKQVNENKK
jgi:hypothetical protein